MTTRDTTEPSELLGCLSGKLSPAKSHMWGTIRPGEALGPNAVPVRLKSTPGEPIGHALPSRDRHSHLSCSALAPGGPAGAAEVWGRCGEDDMVGEGG